MSQSEPETQSSSYKDRKIIKKFIQFFCKNLHEVQGDIVLNLGLDEFQPHQRDHQRVVRDYIGDIIHALGLSVYLPDIGRQNLTQSKETVFYMNCNKVIIQLGDDLTHLPSDEARATLTNEAIVELLHDATRLSETRKFFEKYIAQQKFSEGPEQEKSYQIINSMIDIFQEVLAVVKIYTDLHELKRNWGKLLREYSARYLWTYSIHG